MAIDKLNSEIQMNKAEISQLKAEVQIETERAGRPHFCSFK